MTGLLEFNARAALCRQLAEVEPDSKKFWLAEAESWLRQKPGAAAEAPRTEPAGTWCREVIPKHKHRAVNAAEAQFALRGVAKPADTDTFEEFFIRTLQ
jgi:hypothetical protein